MTTEIVQCEGQAFGTRDRALLGTPTAHLGVAEMESHIQSSITTNALPGKQKMMA